VHAVSEPLEALSSLRGVVVFTNTDTPTLTQKGWFLILAKSHTLKRESGYVRKRLYELLNLTQLGLSEGRWIFIEPQERMDMQFDYPGKMQKWTLTAADEV
jgi:hypothetical protein